MISLNFYVHLSCGTTHNTDKQTCFNELRQQGFTVERHNARCCIISIEYGGAKSSQDIVPRLNLARHPALPEGDANPFSQEVPDVLRRYVTVVNFLA